MRSPAREKVSAGQTPQMPLLVAVQGVPAPGEEPAGQVVQLWHGAKPVTFHVWPGTHAVLHALVALFHA